ncbi:hypothetical protein [Sphingomonas sp.]
MTLGPPLAASLKAVAAAMGDARHPWWIIASAAVALHRADAGCVADVDVLLSIDDAERILPALNVEFHIGTSDDRFRSTIFARWSDPPLPVEFMAGFEYCFDNRWFAVKPKTREAIMVDTASLFVPSRHELRALLLAFGRPKDVRRAHALDQIV